MTHTVHCITIKQGKRKEEIIRVIESHKHSASLVCTCFYALIPLAGVLQCVGSKLPPLCKNNAAWNLIELNTYMLKKSDIKDITEKEK